MDIILSLGTIVLVMILGWITPGPNMFAVMAASLEHGRKHGIATGIGLSLGAFVWAGLAVLGVSILFELFPKAITILKLLGAAYLVWLGLKSIKSAKSHSAGAELSLPDPLPLKKSLYSGVAVSLTNPKAALFFGSVMTAFIPPTAANWYLCLVVILCGVLALLLHSVTATVFSTKTAMRFFNQFRNVISYVFGTVFISLGCSIAFSELRR